jgi:hypothetical protein
MGKRGVAWPTKYPPSYPAVVRWADAHFSNTQDPSIFKSDQVTWLYVRVLYTELYSETNPTVPQNWSHFPTKNSQNFDFYIMQWNDVFGERLADDAAASQTTHILGFNEPDHPGAVSLLHCNHSAHSIQCQVKLICQPVKLLLVSLYINLPSPTSLILMLPPHLLSVEDAHSTPFLSRLQGHLSSCDQCFGPRRTCLVWHTH